MGGCLAVFILLGMLGTISAAVSGDWDSAVVGGLVFFLIPVSAAAIVWHQDQAKIAAAAPPPPPTPKPVSILTCSKCFKHYPPTGREQEWLCCEKCEQEDPRVE